MRTEILSFDNPTHLPIALNYVLVTKKSLLWTTPHIHDELEILFVVDKTLACKTNDGNEIVLSKGDVAIFNQNVIHETLAEVGTEYYILQIPCMFFSTDPSLSFFPTKQQNFALPYIYFRETDEKGSILKDYIMHLFSSEADSKLYVQGYIILIMAFLQKMKFLPFINDVSSEVMQKLLPALQYLNSHFKEKITTKDVAKQLNFNRDYFERLFKKTYGVTVTDYINTLRVNEAKRLLCTTQKAIEEIADICGFSSVPYLNKIFKKYTTLNPAAYRKFKQKNYHPDTSRDAPESEHLPQ